MIITLTLESRQIVFQQIKTFGLIPKITFQVHVIQHLKKFFFFYYIMNGNLGVKSVELGKSFPKKISGKEMKKIVFESLFCFVQNYFDHSVKIWENKNFIDVVCEVQNIFKGYVVRMFRYLSFSYQQTLRGDNIALFGYRLSL